MDISILGLGSIGNRHLNTLIKLKEEFDIQSITLFDTNHERVKNLDQKDKIITISSSIEEAVSNCDAVYICTPTSSHIAVYNEIKNFGKFNLFIEKPLSNDLQGCEDLIFNQKKIGMKTVVGYMQRHNPILIRVKELLDGGNIGRLLNIRAECGFYLPFWHPWEDYRDFYMSWKQGGGGVVLDTSHEIDYMCWLAGEIDQVKGSYGTISDLEITSDDFASAIFKFKNNIFGELHLDLLQPQPSRYVKLIGTKGVLIGDLINKNVKFNTIENAEWQEEKIKFDMDDIYLSESKNVLNYFKNKESKIVSVEEAYHVMNVIHAIRRSHEFGVNISIPFYN